MYKKFLFGAIVLALTACDSGNILDQEIAVQTTGRVVKLTATVSGLGEWDGTTNVALAAFADGNKYASTQRVIPESTPDGETVSITMDNLSADISTVELALTNKLRKRILTLASIRLDDFPSSTDTLRMDLGVLRLGPTDCIRRGVFDVACIQCHGANGHAAAGLDLTRDLPKKDKLEAILQDGGASTLRYNHTDVLSSHFKQNLDEVKNLLYEWMETWK